MLQENLQINIGANTQDLQTGLNQATSSVNNFSASVQRAAKPTGDATQSLVNLSRIAQDAPYGFIGIANNLNPMLESFQRLQVETGSAGNALKAMISGLAGPAGLGLALGVASSLLVKFGDEIFTSSKAIDTWAKNLAETNKQIKETINYSSNQINTMNSLIAVATDYTQSENLRAKALKEIKEQLASVNKEEAQKLTTQSQLIAGAYAYIEALKAQQLQEVSGKKIAELTIQIAEDRNKIASSTGKGIHPLEWIGLAENEIEATQNRIIQAEGLLRRLEDLNKAATVATLNNPFSKSGTQKIDTSIEKDYSLQDRIAEIERLIKLDTDWANAEMKIHEMMQKFNRKGGGDIIQFDLNKGDATPKKLDKELPTWAADYVSDTNKLDKQLQQAQKDAEKFANTLSNNVTNGLMNMFDAMQQGESPLQLLSNFFADLVKQIAAAVIQATIFQAIMSAIIPGYGEAGAVAGGGGFLGGIGKLLGFADGGIVSRPTVAMVGEGGQSEAIMPLNKLGNMLTSTFQAGAMNGGDGGGGNGQFVLKGNDLVLALQRSNYSLNLRRGS